MLLSTKTIAAKWGVSVTWVTILCNQGRIPGAIKEGNRWMIPETAAKPDDARKKATENSKAKFRFIDLFAGIGGFHQAMRYLGGECLMAAEINQECVKTYSLNFKTIEKKIRGDVKKIDPASAPPTWLSESTNRIICAWRLRFFRPKSAIKKTIRRLLPTSQRRSITWSSIF